MYIYMGKRKPKLSRMKRLDVSTKTNFSFYWKRTNLCILTFSLNILLYWQSILILLLYLILQIKINMILCTNTHITKLLTNNFGVIFLDYSKKTRQFAIILHFSEFSSWFLKDNSEKILLQELVEFYNKSLNSCGRFLFCRVAMRDFSKHSLWIVDSLLLPGQ